MSLNVNIASSKPVIREAANMNNDGGGGNLGYMMQGEQDEKKHKSDFSIFSQMPEKDTFGLEKDLKLPKEEFSLTKLITKIICSIKNLFTKK